MTILRKHLAVQHRRLPVLVLVTVWAISACSGSSDSVSNDNQQAGINSVDSDDNLSNEVPNVAEAETVTDVISEENSSNLESSDTQSSMTPMESTGGGMSSNPSSVIENNSTETEPSESDSDSPGTVVQNSTRVNFEITVPLYQSDALQVQILWGDRDIAAAWVTDESWLASDVLPGGTENRLTVTFADQNGAVTLGSFEQNFRTGTNPSQTLQITAAQFDTNRWDSDGDGVSNLDESIAGSNPFGDDLLAPVQAELTLVPDKTFRFSWQPTAGAEFYRVLENRDGVSGFSNISGDIGSNTEQYDHRVALLKRLSASYIVQACAGQECIDSQELLVPESIAEAVGYFKASDAEESDAFGAQVTLSPDGNTMAITRLGDSAFTSTRSERVYVFARVGETWQEQAILRGSESVTGRDFGEELSLSADGDLLAIGSPGEVLRTEEDAPANFQREAGAVYLFKRESGSWQEQARLVSNTIAESDRFGDSVDLSPDGNTLAVGASFDRNNDSCCGAVYIFELIDGSWQQQHRIVADTPNTTNSFGTSISLSEDGRTLAVGDETQPILGDMPVRRVGAAYVFSRSNTGWVQQAWLRADDPVEGAFFGRSISLDADGDVLAVGAPQWNFGEGESRPPIGTAYVFRNVAGNWQQETRLNTTFQGDFTGSSVGLTGDGSTLFVNSPGGPFVTVYKNEGVNWMQQLRFSGVITQEGGDSGTALDSIDRPISSGVIFFSSLSLSSDGETLAIGSSGDGSGARGINGDRTDTSRNNSGAVFLF